MNVTRRNFSVRLTLIALSVMVMLLAMWSLSATAAPLAADFNNSSKTANLSQAKDGDTINYTIVISNSGDAIGAITVTDTLPADLDYVTGTLSVPAASGVIETGSGVANDVITWTGQVQDGSSFQIQFSAIVTGSPSIGSVITNTADIFDGSTTIQKSAEVTVTDQTSYTLMFPSMFEPYEAPVLSSTGATKDGSNYSWTLSWTLAGDPSVEYLVEESKSPMFANSTSYTTTATSLKMTHPASTDNVFYYRVQANERNLGTHSNIISVAGAYYTDFNTIGSWQLVKEDFDDTQNELYVTDGGVGGVLKMHVRGRWDYFISSPLVPAPEPPYRIKTRVRLEGPGNLNTYGVVFGGDWDGNSCPNYTIGATAVSNCFNGYYRNILLWNWGGGTMQSGVKRIFQHSANKNSGQGDTIKDFNVVNVSSGSANDWNEWTWEIFPDGTVNLYAGNDLVQTWNDPTYINRPYWGFWASTDEYPGSDPLYDWVLVEPIN